MVADWPQDVPELSKIVLYVRADLVALWEMWSLALAPDAEVEVKGVQHFSMQGSKNSADIAIAVDAVTDLVRGRISHVAVFSDDSDFMALFAKVKAETKACPESIEPGPIPLDTHGPPRDENAQHPPILSAGISPYRANAVPVTTPASTAPAVKNYYPSGGQIRQACQSAGG